MGEKINGSTYGVMKMMLGELRGSSSRSKKWYRRRLARMLRHAERKRLRRWF